MTVFTLPSRPITVHHAKLSKYGETHLTLDLIIETGNVARHEIFVGKGICDLILELTSKLGFDGRDATRIVNLA